MTNETREATHISASKVKDLAKAFQPQNPEAFQSAIAVLKKTPSGHIALIDIRNIAGNARKDILNFLETHHTELTANPISSDEIAKRYASQRLKAVS